MLGSSLLPVVCWRAHVLFMLFVFVWFVFTSSCLLESSCLIYVICVCLSIHFVLCFLFCFFLSHVLCTQCCHFLWIVDSWLPLWLSLTFVLCLVYPMLPLSLNCWFLIAPLAFSNLCPVFCVPNVATFSELLILDCPFGFL